MLGLVKLLSSLLHVYICEFLSISDAKVNRYKPCEVELALLLRARYFFAAVLAFQLISIRLLKTSNNWGHGTKSEIFAAVVNVYRKW